MENSKSKEFEELARPMIKWLCENYHPHVSVIITPTNAELSEGVLCTRLIDKYLKD